MKYRSSIQDARNCVEYHVACTIKKTVCNDLLHEHPELVDVYAGGLVSDGREAVRGSACTSAVREDIVHSIPGCMRCSLAAVPGVSTTRSKSGKMVAGR